MVELGRLDIYVHVALLSSYLVQPRRGHLEAIYNIYGYLKQHTKPRGMPGQINTFVDANHARNRVTRRSHTGILIYLNRAPISCGILRHRLLLNHPRLVPSS
jgi:hypothetical protein